MNTALTILAVLTACGIILWALAIDDARPPTRGLDSFDVPPPTGWTGDGPPQNFNG